MHTGRGGTKRQGWLGIASAWVRRVFLMVVTPQRFRTAVGRQTFFSHATSHMCWDKGTDECIQTDLGSVFFGRHNCSSGRLVMFHPQWHRHPATKRPTSESLKTSPYPRTLLVQSTEMRGAHKTRLVGQ